MKLTVGMGGTDSSCILVEQQLSKKHLHCCVIETE